MTDHLTRSRPRGAPDSRPALAAGPRASAILSASLAAALAACGGGGTTPPGPDGGNPDMGAVAPVGTLTPSPAGTGGSAFLRPLDTVPTSDGSTFYFTAMSPGVGMGVFKVAANGGSPTQVAAGAPFAAPFGIAITADDKTLIIADTIAGHDPNDPDTSRPVGALFTLPVTGGTPQPLSGTAGTRPRNLDIVTQGGEDTIYFTGVDPSTGNVGVFRTSIGGGALTPIKTGAPFTDPSGVAVTKSGAVYVINTSTATGNQASVIKIADGSTSEYITGLSVGYPAGAALRMDENFLFVSGRDADRSSDQIYVVDLRSGSFTAASDGVATNTDPGGLHRARAANVFSWADLSAGGLGTVYRIEFK